jgi:hypothetical protein
MSCKDNADFRDVADFPCEGWLGYDCLKQASQWYPQDPQELVDFCPKSCGLCKSKVVVSGTSEGPRHDTKFIPEIDYEGHYYPICGLNFWDNDEGASTLCRLSGYRNGGIVIRTNATYVKDAMPIGKCNPGEDVDSCSAGGNAFGDFSYHEGACAAGQLVGIEIVCTQKVKMLYQMCSLRPG